MNLTPRQRQVLHLYAIGLTTEEVAKTLFLSVAGVKSHMARILESMGAPTRMNAVHLAHTHGLLPLGDCPVCGRSLEDVGLLGAVVTDEVKTLACSPCAKATRR